MYSNCEVAMRKVILRWTNSSGEQEDWFYVDNDEELAALVEALSAVVVQ